MEIRFYRKGPEPHYLYVALFGRDSDALISTGTRISSGDWKAQRWPPAAAIVFSEVQKVKRLLEAQEEDVTPYTVKAAYDAKRTAAEEARQDREKKRKQEVKNIQMIADKWAEEMLFGYRPSTQKAVRESIKAFKEYLNLTGQSSLKRSELTQQVITKYDRYLLEKRKLNNSTHGKRMKHLKWFLKSIDFDTSKIKLRTFKKQIITLDNGELEALEAVEVTSKDEVRAKDLFLLGCYTGQRISDLKRISKGSVVGDELRIVRQVKTGNSSNIPLVPPLAAILKKYDWAAPKITEQDLNKSIKEVCRKAGITQEVEVVINRAGLDVKTTAPKCSLITSHVAGKTFISTVGPERYGLTPPEIAAVCGKSLKTLMAHYFNLPRASAKQKMMAASHAHHLKLAK